MVILINMDIPESCRYCGLCDIVFLECLAMKRHPIPDEIYYSKKRPLWCPLRDPKETD